MQSYSARKKNKILLSVGKWTEPEIVLTEVSQTKKDKCHVFSLMRSRYKIYVSIKAELLGERRGNGGRVQVQATGV